MTSIIHSKSYSPVVYQKIRVSTDLYGVMCKIYTPDKIDSGLMQYGNIVYSSTPFMNEKLLIPKAVLFNSKNPYTDIGFFEESTLVLSTISIPRFSKILVTDTAELLSFIISDIETLKDSRYKEVYYKYILTSTSTVVKDIDLELSNVILDESIISSDPDFSSSINSINKEPIISRSPLIKSNKL